MGWDVVILYAVGIPAVIYAEEISQFRVMKYVDRILTRPWGVILILFTVLTALFWKVFNPDYIVFSNDGPLGAIMNNVNQPWSSWFALWDDSQYIGGTAMPHHAQMISGTLMMILLDPATQIIFNICVVFLLIYAIYKTFK